MNMKEYSKRLDAMNTRVANALPENEEQHVFYSAYKTGADGLPIDNLDAIAITGPCRLVMSHDSFYGEGKPYLSEVLESPTWLQVAVAANRGIITTGDYHHSFLEGVGEPKKDDGDGVAVYKFWMGS